jgi:hypothetical protein
MRTYTPSSSIECYIVVPPEYRPQLFTAIEYASGTNLRAIVTFVERKNENRIALASGRTDIYRLGPSRQDIALQITGADENTEAVLEEIVERNIPVYIYPRAGSGLQLNLPLVRGFGVDPLDAVVTHTLTVSAGATVYMPKADAGRGVYFEALSATLPLVDGAWSGNGSSGQLPTGRGVPFFNKKKNAFLNSLISAITYETPYAPGSEWGAYTTASDVWGTDHGIKDSPRCDGAHTYWTKSTTTYLRSFVLPDGIWANTVKSLSFGYRVDGVMNVSIKDAGHNVRYSVNISAGAGRAMIDITGTASSYIGAYAVISLASGSYCEFDCPQLIDSNTLTSSEYMPFLGTVSATVEASVSANSLKVDWDMGADSSAFSTTAADRQGVLLASGYAQPMFDAAFLISSYLCTICQLIGRDSDVKLNLGYDGASALEFALYFGGTERAVVAVTGHKLGDVYAWGLWSGYSTTAITQMYIVRLRDAATFGGSYNDSMVNAHSLYAGNDASGAAVCNCIISGVTVESLSALSCVHAVARLADPGMRNIIRRTIGRWYVLDKATSPRPQDPWLSQGQYIGTEVRTI